MSDHKFKSKSELASEYGIHINTLWLWLKKIKFYEEYPEALKVKLLSPLHLEYIYEKLEPPR